MKQIKRLSIILPYQNYAFIKNIAEKEGISTSALFRKIIQKNLHSKLHTRSSKFDHPIKFTLRINLDLQNLLTAKAKEHNISFSELIRILVHNEMRRCFEIKQSISTENRAINHSKLLDAFWKKDDLPAIVNCIGNIKQELTVKQSLIYVQALVLKGNSVTAISVVNNLTPRNLEEELWVKLAKVRLLIHSRNFAPAEYILNEVFAAMQTFKASSRLLYARFYQCKGEILYWCEKYEDSLELMIKASNYVDFHNHPNILGHIYVQIFMAANKILRLEIAEMAYKRAKEIAKETGNMHLGSWAESEYVNSLLSNHNDEISLNLSVGNNLVVQKKLDNRRGQHYSYSILGRLNLQKHNIDSAYKYLVESKDVENSYRNTGLSFAQVNLWHIEARHSYEDSIHEIKKMKILNRGNHYDKMKYIYYSTKYIYGTNNSEVESGYTNLMKLKYTLAHTIIGAAAKFTLNNKSLYRNL